MHVQYLGEVGHFHLGKGLVTQDASIGAEQIDAAPLPGGAIDHRLNLFEIGNVSAIGHRHATRFADFFDHGLRGRQRAAGAVARTAEIIDHDLGAAVCQPQRMRAAKTIARAGDDSDASVKPDCHECIS